MPDVPDIARADFEATISARLIEETQTLAERWLERLQQLVPVEAGQIFPAKDLLDHIPELILRIATYLRSPDGEVIAANASVVAKAQELGLLRFRQHASAHQILREFELLAAILSTFVKEETIRLELSPDPALCIDLLARLQRAVWSLLQTTVDTFLSKYTEKITAQGRQIEAFNRMMSHELRQPMATLRTAVHLLKEHPEARAPQKLERTIDLLSRNLDRIIDTTAKLERICQIDDSPTAQQVSLTSMAIEVARQLREMADARQVDIRIAQDLPSITVDAARIELVMMNLMSNGINYSDPAKEQCFVDVSPAASRDGACSIVVSDNGLGIPRERLYQIFDRFVRIHAALDEDRGVEGMGLGLAIVRESVDAMGGTIEVQSTEGVGTTFTITIPVAGQ